MKVVILSGGSGNASLIKGLLSVYPQIDIKIIVNAYDDGKSTGVCRKITNTLGVSDVRKNHYRLYELTHTINKGIKAFYNSRHDLPKGAECSYVIKELERCEMSFLSEFVERFFVSINDVNAFDFKDFNLSNIVYSQMYKEKGYEYTNAFFSDFLGIKDVVLINSFDNVCIGAITQNGLLSREEEIVDFCNKNDKIHTIDYHGSSKEKGLLNPKAIEAIKDADLIVISSGTFWSSIYPTLEYGSLYKYINMSNAAKFWIMNNEEDKDAIGVGSNDFISIVETLGLNLQRFVIFENTEAVASLRQSNYRLDILRMDMGNIKGSHDYYKLANCVLRKYYHLDVKYDKIFVDFDDTIWARNDGCLDVSKCNVLMASELPNCHIVTGNSYANIKVKIKQVAKCSSWHNTIWADASSLGYANDRICDVISKHIIAHDNVNRIMEFMPLFVDKSLISINNEFFPACIKIRPIIDSENRIRIWTLINEHLKVLGLSHIIEARLSGKSSIDIVSKNNDKKHVLEKMATDDDLTLYIGDDVLNGNDKNIANLCTNSIHVKDVHETNVIFKLLKEI